GGGEAALEHRAAQRDRASPDERDVHVDSPRVRLLGALSHPDAARPARRSMSWILWVTPVVLLFLGLPIFLCFLAGSIAALLFVTSVPPSVVTQVMFGSIDSFTLLAVPFFLFAGELMGRGAIADRLVRWCMALFGGVRGSLGLVTVGSCVVFGAISGSSAA